MGYFRLLFLILLAPFNLAVSAEELTVGALLPLSGNYATIGDDNRQGFEVARELLDANSAIKLIYADSKADASISVNEFKRLVDIEKVKAVFAMRGPVGMALNPLSAASGIPLLGGVGNREFAEGNKYAFQIWSRSDLEGASVAKLMAGHNYSSVALVTAQDDWPDAVSKGFREQVQNSGLKLIYDEEILPAETEFRTMIRQIRSKEPSVIFANLGLAQFAPFLRQLQEQKLSVPVYANFWVAKKEVVEGAGISAIEGVRFVEMDTGLPRFREAVLSKFGTIPSAATLSSYVGTLLLGQAVRDLKGGDLKGGDLKGGDLKGGDLKADHGSGLLYASLLKQTEVRTPDGALPIRDRCVIFPLVERVMRKGQAK